MQLGRVAQHLAERDPNQLGSLDTRRVPAMPPHHTSPINSLEFHSMPIQTRPTNPILHDAIPMGTDFIGGATALPVKSAGPGQAVPGSDFAGGALPLTAEVEQGEPDKERAA
jgi:hypothetical protein